MDNNLLEAILGSYSKILSEIKDLKNIIEVNFSNLNIAGSNLKKSISSQNEVLINSREKIAQKDKDLQVCYKVAKTSDDFNKNTFLSSPLSSQNNSKESINVHKLISSKGKEENNKINEKETKKNCNLKKTNLKESSKNLKSTGLEPVNMRINPVDISYMQNINDVSIIKNHNSCGNLEKPESKITNNKIFKNNNTQCNSSMTFQKHSVGCSKELNMEENINLKIPGMNYSNKSINSTIKHQADFKSSNIPISSTQVPKISNKTKISSSQPLNIPFSSSQVCRIRSLGYGVKNIDISQIYKEDYSFFKELERETEETI